MNYLSFAPSLLKKLTKIDYKKNDIEPEKLTISKGIGLKFFEENWETIYKYDYIPTEDRNFKPPKYYDRKLKEINPELLEEIKKHRREIFTQNIENEINSQPTLLTEITGNKQRRLHKNLKKFLNHWETKTKYLKLNIILLRLKSENKISHYGWSRRKLEP
ncbi:hypothetical protein [Spiroplasma endosymbiont of Zeiraphera isertana]|uniref:hypothetical protein n=1 Tax=Spiroplasma endosymbiont of Zeiraphera isertana TaxID=3066313 RepID=UPI00313C390F